MAAQAKDNQEMAVVDVFNEVDEELRREKLVNLWKKFGPFVLGAVVLFIGGMSLNVWWQSHVRSERMEESERYQEAVFLANGGSEEKALQAFEEIVETSKYGYGLLSRLQRASILARLGRAAEAVTEYDLIAADGSLALRFRDYASLMAAMILMEMNNNEDVALRLQPLTEAGRPWYYSASEQLGLWYFKNTQYDEARTIFQSLMLDEGAPPDLRGRATEILQMVENADPQNLLGEESSETRNQS